MEEQNDKPWYLCQRCIDAIRSRGEKVFVGEPHWNDEEYDEDCIECEWCGEIESVVYECL
jgi:hypothetical protein